MRYILILLAVLVLAFSAAAQDNSSASFQLTPGGSTTDGTALSTSAGSIIPAVNLTTSAAASALASAAAADPSAPSLNLVPSPSPQGAVAVYETYPWQVAGNYSFFRFYEVPNTQENMNGVIINANYYFLNWLAGEGEFMGEWGHQAGFKSRFEFAGGGPRFRWSGPRNIELFGHFLVGYTHFVPQTSFGSQQAFAYVVGGGGDLNMRNRHFAYRVGADLVGSRYFSTYQYSPRVYVGFVFKF